MYLDDKAEIVAEYIKDSRYKQAVLINGTWGAGKTYFIDKKLMHKLSDYIVIKYSLYGVASSAQLLSDLQKQMLVKLIENKEFNVNGKPFKLPSKVLELTPNISNIIWKKIGLESDDLNNLIGSIEYDKSKMLIIFDDLERSSIEINEVLGIINSFVESQKTKVIIIANEKEIGSSRVSTNLPEKFAIAANKVITFENNETTQKSSQKHSGDSDKKTLTYSELIDRTKKLFSNDIIYNSIKEKLIGLSVTIFADFVQIYEELIKEYAFDSKVILLENKDAVIEILHETNCQNIRTLIFGIITFDNIYKEIKALLVTRTDSEYLDLLNKEIVQILRSVIYSSVIYKSGKTLSINDAFFSSRNYMNITLKGLKEYSFINRYICYHEFDTDSVSKSIDNYINEIIEQDRQEMVKEYLSFYKLDSYEWVYLEDDDVIRLMDQLYDELKQNNYDVRYFRDIIKLFLQLDYNFSEKKSLFNHTFEEYIKLMESYILEHELKENQEELLDSFTLDGEALRKYNDYASSLIRATKEKENKIFNASNILLFDSENWSEEFYNMCKNQNKEFFHAHKFLASFDIDPIIKALDSANNHDISNFARGICAVYNFSNINEFYKLDQENLSQIISKLRQILLDEETGCTKKIILNTYIGKLEEKLASLS